MYNVIYISNDVAISIEFLAIVPKIKVHLLHCNPNYVILTM